MMQYTLVKIIHGCPDVCLRQLIYAKNAGSIGYKQPE